MLAHNISDALEEILPRVQKPGRYSGGELNSVEKDWHAVDVRLALAFPDIYELGMSNLGLMILYDLVNQRSDMLAERVFSPWIDMENEMRAWGIPLFSLENKQPVSNFDVLGISLPYEQLYTNALNLLDLSGIPLLSVERQDHHPLVIAGGHAIFNPEPMACFIDAFAIGDGEELLIDILELVIQRKNRNVNRSDLLHQMASIPGVYVPSMYNVAYHTNGLISRVTPFAPNVPNRVL